MVKNTMNQDVTPEDERNIIDDMLICADPDCKLSLRDHEVRLRKVEIAMADNNRLVESVVKIIESNEDTQKATVKSLNELTQAVIKIDGKVDNFGRYDAERKEQVDQVKEDFRTFKKEFWKNEDEMKIDPRKVMKKAFESWMVKILIGVLSAAGAWQLIVNFLNSLPK